MVEFVRKKPPSIKTVADVESHFSEKLWYKVMNNRLFKLGKIFYEATVQISSVVPPLEGAQLSISTGEGRLALLKHWLLRLPHRLRVS